jgi:S-adenosylmethionine hydrolase
MRLVALLSDFGIKDTYAAEMKAVILSYSPTAVIVDITHDVQPFNTLEGAFLLSLAAKTFPGGTIFLAVVDPLVGSARDAIVVRTSSGKVFVGPDTGLLYPAASSEGITNIYRVRIERMGNVSGTFHGRDVFAHIVGRLAAGFSCEELLEEKTAMSVLEIPKPLYGVDYVEVRVLHVDRFGNAILSHRGPLTGDWRMADVYVGDSKLAEAIVAKYYSEAGPGEVLLTVGGTGYLELAVNQGDAAEKLGLKAGDVLKLVKSRH